MIKEKISKVLEDMLHLDNEATNKLLLIKVPCNKKLRSHPAIHFYDDKLTVFGVIAGLTENNTPLIGGYVDPYLIINFFNDLLTLDKDAIKKLIESRVPCNNDLADHPDILVLVNSDSNGNPINHQIGLLGVLNGLTGIDKETGLGKIGAQYNCEYKLTSFTYPLTKEG